ncbi:MAG: hypothetical protein AAF340_18385 [Pseudomonadota bacterium]
MSSYKTEVQNIRYNAATGSFEALVVMHEGAETLKFPTAIELPISSDFAFVSHKLVALAKKRRKENAGQLVSRTLRGQARFAHLGDLARQLTDSMRLTGRRAA